jgi:hypothetical protein
MSDYIKDTEHNLTIASAIIASANIAVKLAESKLAKDNLKAFEEVQKSRESYWKQNEHNIAIHALNVAENMKSLMSYRARTAIGHDPQHIKLTAAIDVASRVNDAATYNSRYYIRNTEGRFYSHGDSARYEAEEKGYLFVSLISALITLLDSAADIGAKRNNFVYGDMKLQTIRDKTNINKRCTELVERIAGFVIEPKNVELAPCIFASDAFKSIEAIIDAARKEVAACKALDDYTKSAEFARIPAVSNAFDAQQFIADLGERKFLASVACKENLSATLSERAFLKYDVYRASVDVKHAIEICRVSATAVKLSSELPTDFAYTWEMFTVK